MNNAVNTFVAKVIAQILDPIILLLAAGAFLGVLWGIVMFIANAGNDAKRKTGRVTIMWGLIGLVIIFGAYGIINFALGIFNIPAIHKFTP